MLGMYVFQSRGISIGINRNIPYFNDFRMERILIILNLFCIEITIF